MAERTKHIHAQRSFRFSAEWHETFANGTLAKRLVSRRRNNRSPSKLRLKPHANAKYLLTYYKCNHWVVVLLAPLETFRFKDENDYRLPIRDLTSSFFSYSQNTDSPESFILLFFTRKVITVTFSEGGCTLSWRKMIKLLTFDNLFPLLQHSP